MDRAGGVGREAGMRRSRVRSVGGFAFVAVAELAKGGIGLAGVLLPCQQSPLASTASSACFRGFVGDVVVMVVVWNGGHPTASLGSPTVAGTTER